MVPVMIPGDAFGHSGRRRKPEVPRRCRVDGLLFGHGIGDASRRGDNRALLGMRDASCRKDSSRHEPCRRLYHDLKSPSGTL
jgi:hypothetical protein